MNTSEKRYAVTQYDEAGVEPAPAREFATLAEAREYARRAYGGARDASQAGERYEDGSRHVEAFYTDKHRSSGCWILEVT